MHKEIVTYVDWNGVERTEEFYFNLTEQELVVLNAHSNSSLSDKLKAIVAAKDEKEIIDFFEKILYLSYGVKSEDGRRFIKTEQVKDEFLQTPAYSKLFMKLGSDSDAAAKFINETIEQPKVDPTRMSVVAGGAVPK